MAKWIRHVTIFVVVTLSSIFLNSLTFYGISAQEAPAPFWTFAQITDLHYGYSTNTDDAVHDAIRFINSRISPYNISFTVLTGDLIHYANETSARNLKNYLDTNLNTVYLTIQGNHDGDALYLKYFGNHQTNDSVTYYSWVNGSYRFIAIGQNRPRDIISSAELGFLETELAKTETPIVLFHECLAFPNSTWELANPQDIISVMKTNNAKMFVCGHTHQFGYRRVSGRIHQFHAGAASNAEAEVTLYNITGTIITAEHWHARDSSRQYNPSLIDRVTIDLEGVPPSIGVPSNEPFGDIVPYQPVKVLVSVIDAESGVKNVTLSYTTEDSTSWFDLPMNYNSLKELFEATIPGHPREKLVKYKIVAFDNAQNQAVKDNKGQYYVYHVIPEFPTLLALFILILSMTLFSLAVITYRRKHLTEHQRYLARMRARENTDPIQATSGLTS